MTYQLNNPMLDPNNLLSELRAIENKIKLSQQIQQANNYNQPVTQPITSETLVNSINELVDHKLASMGLTRTEQVKEQAATQPKPLTPEALLEKKINDFAINILTTEQLEWVSNPTIFSGIPLFLTSNKGKELMAMMIDEYKVFLDR